MKVKILVKDAYRVVGVMDGDQCAAEDFLLQGASNTAASRMGMFSMLEYVAANGLQNMPSAWSHEADKPAGIYEFIKGPLRLFYFKGLNGEIAVCTSGVRKSGQKADKAAVAHAIAMKKQYMTAVKNNTYEVAEDEDE